MRFFLSLLIVSFLGCSPKKAEKPKEVDNTATRYAENLQHSLEKARATADIANEKIAERQNEVKTDPN